MTCFICYCLIIRKEIKHLARNLLDSKVKKMFYAMGLDWLNIPKYSKILPKVENDVIIYAVLLDYYY